MYHLNNITWNDVVLNLTDYSKRYKPPENIYCWHIFKTPDNEEKPFNRKAFFNYMLGEIGELQPLFADVNTLCIRLKAWTKTRLPYWQRIYNILCADYEPLWNYNRFDETQDKTDTLTDVNNKVAGYDSGELVESGKQDSEENKDFTHENHSYGNIGVMSTQDLIKQEIEIANISMYDIILSEFKETFCIGIYS